MCYGADSHPPDHGIAGEVAEEQGLSLTSADGTQLMAHLARAAAPSGNGIVICPDVRGLHTFYCALARGFAQAGIDAIAFDYFGRTVSVTDREEDFHYQPHVAATTPATIAADVAAAITALRDRGRVQHVFTVGFCFGGAQSWRQAAAQPGLAGAIGFYGRPERVRGVIDQMQAPLLLLVAGRDFTPQEDFQLLDRELTDAGVPHKMVVYPDAPHSFFDRSFAEHRDACADAWRQIFDFIASPPV